MLGVNGSEKVSVRFYYFLLKILFGKWIFEKEVRFLTKIWRGTIENVQENFFPNKLYI